MASPRHRFRTAEGQPEKSRLYLRGLMLDGQRKSLQPMAERNAQDFC